jgi:hypothetical protein
MGQKFGLTAKYARSVLILLTLVSQFCASAQAAQLTITPFGVFTQYVLPVKNDTLAIERNEFFNPSNGRMGGFTIPVHGDPNRFVVMNVAHSGQNTWMLFEYDNIDHVDLSTPPMPLNQFHGQILVYFKKPVTLTSLATGQTYQVGAMTFGTGPSIPFSFGSIIGRQNLATLTRSLEQNKKDDPTVLKNIRHIDPSRIDIKKLMLAFFEESTRLRTIQLIRILHIRAELGILNRDSILMGRYFLPTENCVSSVARNLAIALKDQGDREALMTHPMLTEQFKSFKNVPSTQALQERLDLVAKILARLSVGMERVRAAVPELRNKVSAEVIRENKADIDLAIAVQKRWYKTFGRHDMNIALPASAKMFFDIVLPPGEALGRAHIE